MGLRRRWLAAAAIGVGALVLGTWGAYTWRLQQANQQLVLAVETERQRNFHALASHVQDLETLLAKGLVTGSPGLNQHYMGEVRRHTGAAVSHFTGLPLPAAVNAATGKFLAQAGDFAYSLARREAAGQTMTPSDRQQLAGLHQRAVTLNGSLQDLSQRIAADGYRWQEPQPVGLAGLLRIARPPAKPSAEPQSPMNMVPGGMLPAGGEEELPALVYDGPFSDQVANRAPAMVGPPVSREEAAARLERFVPNLGQYRVAEVVDADGTIPAWTFRLASAGGGHADTPGPALSMDVAKAGGYLVELVNARPPGAPSLSLEQARELGRAYLDRAGFADMAATYAEVTDGFATIQYVYRQGEVLVYPDQVRVRVALDNGEVTGVDAAPYLMAHRPRALPAPRVSPEEAQAALNGDLEVEAVQLAVIPDEAGVGELMAYEFRAQHEGDTFLVYVNAATGAEERILQLIQSEDGTLAL